MLLDAPKSVYSRTYEGIETADMQKADWEIDLQAAYCKPNPLYRSGFCDMVEIVLQGGFVRYGILAADYRRVYKFHVPV